MCGIAGIFNYADPNRAVDERLLRRMTTRLSHRGPDADGYHVNGPIGLGHRRLAIVDLSPTGAQPMPTADRQGWIVYNGEFYNHLEYRARLSARGITFRGSSDTETLLHTVRELGPDALDHASGIFGFAYWDAKQCTLTLARDPLGVKQVYYHDDGERIIFASEIKSLLCDPTLERELNPLAVSEYLHFHTPLFEKTFFQHIRQVRPGEWLRFSRNRMQAHRYWTVNDFEKSPLSPSDQVAELKEKIGGVVNDQLMADVPVAAFFSGGIDSTAVAAFASRSGRLKSAFGVHFANQGVVDERPYQEEAARALGLDLQLTTLDGGSFPTDLEKLLYFQDQPVIGPAKLPMYAVSKLAAANFKVCMGGQASDEVFGGYARYALARPGAVIRNWFASTRGEHRQVGGNLSKQLAQGKNLRRIAANLSNMGDWQTSYFETFAKVPISRWEELFEARELCDREHCRRMFEEETNLSKATDPADKIQEWDLRTYLTGLFQQDDRMSMSVGLESRVPLADPRLVRHAFKIPFDLKFRRGATKWILREAIADLVPASVLNRIKVGFDTPVHSWMAKQHLHFVRETLLSSRARSRGIWSPTAIDALLRNPGTPLWTDLTWKALNIELWAKLFLDSTSTNEDRPDSPYRLRAATNPAKLPETPHRAEGTPVANLTREVRELGLGRTLARASWELRTRLGLTTTHIGAPHKELVAEKGSIFCDAPTIHSTLAQILGPSGQPSLAIQARNAAYGRIPAFGNWTADYGYPLTWHTNPLNGREFRRTPHWSGIYAEQGYVGDIKLAWEAGRFPQCFTLARAAASNPSAMADLEGACSDQILHFIATNPINKGVHWCNGQEVALRLLAWTFALDAFPSLHVRANPRLAESIAASTQYIEDHLEYAQRSVYNNHLISEAFGLLLGGMLLPEHDRARGWVKTGTRILEEEADRQFYPDGAYISQSHNYHRAVLQIYLAAIRLVCKRGLSAPDAWNKALHRSLDFLFAQQNPTDGRLPNYGGNDGAMPLILSSCDYSDFRPTLQAVSAAVRGELLYPAGPWDEMALWLSGPETLNLPRRDKPRTCVSFADTGYHILRGQDQESFASFRCGTLKDRFSQIDMLHVDVWWRGHNVLLDTGSYLYNGPSEWHTCFYGTEGHNTVTVNGRNQMPHVRKFKSLYPTQAALQTFRPEIQATNEGIRLASVSGEHYGYKLPFGVTHRRTLLFDGLERWVVVDDLTGSGEHDAQLLWHGGDFTHRLATTNRLTLETNHGDFHIAVFTGSGQPIEASLACGQEDPPAGWHSRYYAVKSPIPRLSATQHCPFPARFISVLSPHCVSRIEDEGDLTTIHFEDGQRLCFRREDPSDAMLHPASTVVPSESTEQELVRS